MNSCYMLIKVGKGRCLMTTLLAKVYFSHFIFWGWWLWNKKLLFKFRYEKINLDSVPLLLIKLVWKNLLPSLFYSLKLKTWSCANNKQAKINFLEVVNYILVNNAGITRDNLMMRMKDEDWSCVLETNPRICRPFMEPKNRFSGWRAGTTTLFFVPARQAT